MEGEQAGSRQANPIRAFATYLYHTSLKKMKEVHSQVWGQTGLHRESNPKALREEKERPWVNPQHQKEKGGNSEFTASSRNLRL